MISQELFFTLGGISIFAIISLVIIIVAQISRVARLKDEVEIGKEIIDMLEENAKISKRRLRHAKFNCSRCGRFTSKLHWDGVDPVCASCWKKHLEIRSRYENSNEV